MATRKNENERSEYETEAGDDLDAQLEQATETIGEELYANLADADAETEPESDQPDPEEAIEEWNEPEPHAPPTPHGLYAKLAHITSMVQPLAADGYNQHYGFNYIPQASVYNQIRTLLGKFGICFFAEVVGVKNGSYLSQGKEKPLRQVKFLFTFVDGETGEKHTCVWQAEAIDDGDKSISKASAQALKYFLIRTFLVSASEEDPDANGHRAPETTQEERESKEKPAPSMPKNGRDFTTFYGAFLPWAGVDLNTAKVYLGRCDGDAKKAAQMILDDKQAAANDPA